MYQFPLTHYSSCIVPFDYWYILICLKQRWLSGELQTSIRCHTLWHVIWVYTVCSGLFVQIPKVCMEIQQSFQKEDNYNKVRVSTFEDITNALVLKFGRVHCPFGHLVVCEKNSERQTVQTLIRLQCNLGTVCSGFFYKHLNTYVRYII